MDTRIVVRPLHAHDVDEVLALAPRLCEGAAPWRPAEGFLAAAQRWLLEDVDGASEQTPVWVAERSGRVVGVAAARLQCHFSGPLDCYLGELVVHPDVEGRGVGRQLVATVESWAADRGAACVTLETGAANERARAFYASLGYAEEQVRLTRVLGQPGP